MELQEELLLEILAKLPVKSLIRFICVCKYWQSIITSSEFATKHYATRLKHNSTNNGYDCILSQFSPARSISITSYENLTCETAFKFRPAVAYEPPKFGVSHRDVTYAHDIYGPCNGLFLLAFSREAGYSFDRVWLLWNPATRDVIRVPSLKGFSSCYLGFGFDPITLDYKVVCFDFTAYRNPDTKVLLLYSLAANSWRQLDDVSSMDNITYGGKLFVKAHCFTGRKHHWIMSDVSGGLNAFPQFLLSFDMVDEVFVQTPMPCVEAHYSYRFLEQGSNDVHPTIIYVDNGTMLEGEGEGEGATTTRVGIHIWGLSKYGPTGSWNKLKSLAIPRVVASSPMVLWKNKAIVFANYGVQQAMARYDLITEEITSLHLPGDDTILAYTESLFSVAKFVQRPPPGYSSSVAAVLREHPKPYYYSLEMVFLHHRDMSSGGRVQHEEDNTLLEAEFQQLVQQNYDDDDDDSSSTDSAFLMPVGPPLEDDTILVDHQTDLKFRPHRRNEQLRLSHLPYCLREVNQPMISNPCTF